ncbi:DUF222 domain-containing protein [Modestobacter sp. I12A-02628]|uniref:DUF222 domain-containing protein n=1 Tax=Goekera deserti TaxID=2497753 RepID=A0A7K3WDC5_9ACTN|nr:HNH endonuclease signature motif containing protein [Goekera deserti]MPQ98353.1 DUF222 domain-containing protein [Goekera deserti]NDI48180.1 DUF222 domain-containing protein [Goekera deserti]NEL53929.1 DUF222 domain-containing protein [Goekera deserti]
MFDTSAAASSVVAVDDTFGGRPRPVGELAEEIVTGAVRLSAATASWLRLVAEFDRREGWAGHGVRSCAHWLAWQCGLEPGTAREHVRTARALCRLPVLSGAFAAGRVSYSKVRALTRIAEPGSEAELLEFARHATAAQVERVVRGWRRVDANTAAGAAAAAGGIGDPGVGRDGDAGTGGGAGGGAAVRRRPEVFEHHWDADGMLSLRVRMPAEDGAELLAAIESLVERSARRDRAAARQAAAGQVAGRAAAERAAADRTAATPTAADRADARGEAADEPVDHRSSLTGQPGPVDAFPQERGGEQSGPVDASLRERGGEQSGPVETSLRGRRAEQRCSALRLLARAAADADRRAGDPPRREVVVHVDAAVLAEDTAAGRAHVLGGPALTAAQVRRLACQASIVAIVERDGEVLAQGRRHRYATRAQRRALLARDGGCARPGCEETRVERLHAHHLRPWRLGGRTDVSAMVLLCDTDHGLAHDEDLRMTRHRGQLVVTTPAGERVWGPADTAFDDGLTGVTSLGRRPTTRPVPDPTGAVTARSDAATDQVSGSGQGSVQEQGPAPSADVLPLRLRPGVLDDLLPSPVAADPTGPGGERMDLHHVLWVLMTHRDVIRRRVA